MAVLGVSMMYWTSQAEDAMKKGGLAGLKAFGEKLNKQVSKQTILVGVVSYDYYRMDI